MSRLSIPAVALVAALSACSNDSPPLTAVAEESTTRLLIRGERIAQDLCSQCHGPDFEGATFGTEACPSLGILGRYSLTEFNRLLTSGLARDGTVLTGTMRFIPLLDVEDREALFRYLTSRQQGLQ